MGKIISLGWDVGGYTTNKNAFAIATESAAGVTLRLCKKEEINLVNGYYDFPFEIFKEATQAIIAIDAPFGFPDQLRSFIIESKSVGIHYPSDKKNLYVYRGTDLKIIKSCGKKPLSPIFDYMGRNTLRTIMQLRKWQTDHRALTVYPWDSPHTHCMATEVYPGLLAGDNTYAQQFLNQFQTPLSICKLSDGESLYDLIEQVYLSKCVKKNSIKQNDEIDAAICALMGLLFAKDLELGKITDVTDESQKREGTIYVPSTWLK